MELRLLRPVLAQLHQEQPRLLPVLRLLPYASLENLLAEDDVQVLLSSAGVRPAKSSLPGIDPLPTGLHLQ